MSEPVSNAEIEDVLSSIRRLVSNDVEAIKEEAPKAPAVAEPAGKLILTADFRIAEPEDSHSEAMDEGEADGIDGQDIAQPEVVAEPTLEFRHSDQTSEAAEEAEAAPEENNAVWQDTAEEITEDAADATPSLEDTIADLEAAIGQQKGEWEPDGSDFEEDPDAEEVMSEPVQDWIDGTAQEVGVEADEATTDDDDDLFGAAESVIDEETLRDMVSDIVRQELQGALGERITRNVRKLVRREINRVLAAQDFD